MRKTFVLLALAAASAAVVAPASAATKLPKAKNLVVTDPAGDATGAGMAAPTNRSDADIVSFSLSRKDNGKKVTGVVAKITMAAAPTQAHDYRIKMSVDGCSTYYIEYQWDAQLGAQPYIRENCGGSATGNFDPVDASVVGNSIVFDLPLSSFPGDVKLGSVLTVTGAESVLDETAVIVGTLDTVSAPAGTTYKIGQ